MALQAEVLEIRRKEEKKQSVESLEDPNSFFSGLESFPTTMIQNFFLVWTFLPYERRYAKTNFITVSYLQFSLHAWQLCNSCWYQWYQCWRSFLLFSDSRGPNLQDTDEDVSDSEAEPAPLENVEPAPLPSSGSQPVVPTGSKGDHSCAPPTATEPTPGPAPAADPPAKPSVAGEPATEPGAEAKVDKETRA